MKYTRGLATLVLSAHNLLPGLVVWRPDMTNSHYTQESLVFHFFCITKESRIHLGLWLTFENKIIKSTGKFFKEYFPIFTCHWDPSNQGRKAIFLLMSRDTIIRQQSSWGTLVLCPEPPFSKCCQASCWMPDLRPWCCFSHAQETC